MEEERVRRVLEHTSLVYVADHHGVKLDPLGDKHVGLCPFHSEKTPSFTVDEKERVYRCFGCGAGGNAVNFVAKMRRISDEAALDYLERLMKGER